MASFRARTNSRGKTRWQAEVKVKGHPIVRRTFPRKSDAETWATNTEAHIKVHGHLPESAVRGRTLKEAIREYERDRLPSLKASTRRTRQQHLVHWQETLGAYALSAITPSVIQREYGAIATRSGGATANRHLSSLSGVYKHAWKVLRWVDHNPCRDIACSKDSPTRVRYLTPDEHGRLMAACRDSSDPRLYPLVLLALSTGARRGELLGLKWRDLDLDRGRAVIHDTKTKERESLTVHGEVLKILERASKTPHVSGYVFANIDGVPSFPGGPWKTAIRDSRIEDFRFHDLRHTFATNLLRAGATLAELKAALRHSTFAAVQRYAHLAEDHAEDVTRRMVDQLLR